MTNLLSVTANRQQIQAAIAAMTADEIRQALNKPDLETDEALHVRSWASRVELVAQNQIETQDYVFGDPMGPINEMAFDLLAIEAQKDRPPVPLPEVSRVADWGLEPPF